jgi:hypothetical protein
MMHFGNELKKAMVDCNVKNAVTLSNESNVPYGKVIRVLNGDGSSRHSDIEHLADFLDLEIKFIKKVKV